MRGFKYGSAKVMDFWMKDVETGDTMMLEHEACPKQQKDWQGTVV